MHGLPNLKTWKTFIWYVGIDISSYRGELNINYDKKLKTSSKSQRNIEGEHSGSEPGIVSQCLISVIPSQKCLFRGRITVVGF